jgi:fatty-acyl-CoA synthase
VPAQELNLALVFEGVAARLPDRPAILHGDHCLTFAELGSRARRLARYLHDQGLGCFAERGDLAGHEPGQHLLAQLLHNGPEYVEGLLGSYRARVAPFNVNYRYTADEIRYVLLDAGARAVQFHACFAPVLAEVLPDLPADVVLLQVADGSGHPLLPGAVDYEAALASVPPELDEVTPSPDDLYLIYTGGTTGKPKGVMWRQADLAVAGLGLIDRRQGTEWKSLDDMLEAMRPHPIRLLSCAPFMHGAGQWAALQVLAEGNTLVIHRDPSGFDPGAIWDTVAEHQVAAMLIVGDAFARPLADELEARPREVTSLRMLTTGGAATQPAYKERLRKAIPGLAIVDNVGSSESGIQARNRHEGPSPTGVATFEPDRAMAVVSADYQAFLTPGHEGTGWLAKRGRIPLGYLHDAAKSERTFPVVEGLRVTIPGDRVRQLADGQVVLLGRDAAVINTGGEKVYAEEVEAAVKLSPQVLDAVVCGRPSERWGSEVVAIISAAPGTTVDESELLELCARQLARYKLPKAFVVVPEVRRSAAGKADYRWAAELAGGAG